MAKKFSRQNLQKFLVDNLDHNSDDFRDVEIVDH